MSMEQAEKWATRPVGDRVARAIQEHEVWVAVEGATIGWVEVDRDRVAALYVSPSSSGRGIGSALLARAEMSIRDSGYATARLESSQNALGFYLRRAYVRCGPPDADGAWPLRKDVGRNQTRSRMTPNRKTIEAYMDGFRTTDRPAILSCLTDDVEWVLPGAFHVRGKDEFARHIVDEGF